MFTVQTDIKEATILEEQMKITIKEEPSEYWGIVKTGVTYDLVKTAGPVIHRPQFTTHLRIKWLAV